MIHEVLLESESPSLDVQQEGSLEGFGVDSEPLLKDREVISIREIREQEQCDQIWRFFCHIGTILKVLGNFLWVYLVFGEMFILLWQKCYAIGQVFIVVDSHIL